MNILLSFVLLAGLAGSLDRNLVTPEWLQNNLDNPYVVVVEVGSGPMTDRPHIPGARYLAIESIVARGGWPPDELPPVDNLRAAFENAGIGDSGRIVLYSREPLYATRAWFTLDYLGQADRAAILDGGTQRWLAEKRPLWNKRVAYGAKTFTPYPDRTRVIELEDVRRAVDEGAMLIDARQPQEFNGSQRGRDVIRRGHIPDAECLPWQSNLSDGGSFASMASLRTRYGNVIGQPEGRVIVYCRTGMEATMPYFVLRSLGYDVALYDGSFTEWSREKTLPVEWTSLR